MTDGQITKKEEGRPTKNTEETVKKLESIFKVGGTVEEACSYAGISKPTYYQYIKDDQSFLTKMETAQHYADIMAKHVVTRAIVEDKDLGTAKWWLEKREFKPQNQFQTTTNIQINNLIEEDIKEFG